MGKEKFLLVNFLLIFLITSVSAIEFTIYVEVKNASSPNRPIQNARVMIFGLAGYSPFWEGLTNAEGKTPEIFQNRPIGTYRFNVSVSKEGFQDKNLTDIQLTVTGSPLQNYKLTTVLLNSAGPCNNNGQCEASLGETSVNCPSDCPVPPPPPLSSGIVNDVQIVIPQSGQTSTQCPSGYAEKGAFNDASFNTTHKLCVRYVSLSQYVQGETYIKDVYLQPRLGSGPVCELGDISIRQFSGGDTFLTFCIKRGNVNDLSSDQYLTDVIIANSDTCTSFYNKHSPAVAFRDYNNNLRRLCSKIQNLQSSIQQGNCQLTNPRWMISNPLMEITDAVGWVNFQGDYSNYDFQNGTNNLILYVQATGCKEDQVRFEIYKDDSQTPGNGERKFVIPLSNWHEGYKFASWRPVWTEAIIGNPNAPNYYSFKALVGNVQTIQSDFSRTLTVRKPPEAECKYRRNSDLDDKECSINKGKGFFCVEGNYCTKFQCRSNSDCKDGEFCCPAGEDKCLEGTCVQCYKDAHCKESSNFGADYVCNLELNKCYSTKPCVIEKPIWIGQSGNDLVLFDENGPIVYKGFVSSTSHQRGTKLGLKAKTSNCENVDDFEFFVVSDRGLLMKLLGRDQTEMSLRQSGMGRFEVVGDKIIQQAGFELPWFLDLGSLSGGGSVLKYKAYVASKSNPQIKSQFSDEINIGPPAEAECVYTENSDSDDRECLDRKGAGKICSPDNVCVDECKKNADCIEKNLPPFCGVTFGDSVGAIFGTNPEHPARFKEIPGVIKGKCYECFMDEHCSLEEKEKYCAPESSQKRFSCVECYENKHCPANSEGNPGLCVDNKCTVSCNPNRDPQNPNIDCLPFRIEKSEKELLAMNRQKRAELKGREICDPESRVCVQCDDNWNGRTNTGCTVPGSCCFIGTACLIEENRCVQCIEDSICGEGMHCNKEKHVCESGVASGKQGGLSEVANLVLLVGAAFAGYMAFGPSGLSIGLLVAQTILGGLGGGEGLEGLGNILNIVGGLGS